MDTEYRNNLKDGLTACKNYTDKTKEEILWKLGEFDITTSDDNTTALVKTVPSNATRVKIKRIYGNSVKYAPSTAYDDSVAKDKVIPENTYTTELNTLGGMSYKSENLMSSSIEQGVINGATGEPMSSNERIRTKDYITLSSGTYTISWIETLQVVICVYDLNDVYQIGESVLSWQNVGVSFTLTSQRKVKFTWKNTDGTTLTPSDISNIMLNSGSTALPYQPYFDGIRDSKTTAIKFEGNNKYNFELNETYLQSSNSIITIKQGYSGWNQKTGADILLKANTTYYFDLFPSTTPNATTTIAFISSDNTTIKDCNLTSGNAVHTTYTPTADITISKINFYTNASLTSDITIKVSIGMNIVSNESDFIPYIVPITKAIPQEIQALEGYGWGINSSVYNYVDLNTKKFIQKVGRIKVSDTNWTYGQSGGQYNRFISDNVNNSKPVIDTVYPNILTNSLTTYKQSEYILQDSGISIASASPKFLIRDTSITTVEELLQKYGNDFIYYELNTPIETDISAYLPTDFNKIATNDNYTNIEFVSEYGYDIPNKISFYGTIKETLCTAINKNNALAVSLTNNDAKYGWSAGNVANVRDYTTIKGGQKVARVDLGTLNYILSTSSGRTLFKTTISDIVGQINTSYDIPAICSIYNAVSTNKTWVDKDMAYTSTQLGSKDITFVNNDYNTAADFKAAMSGVYLYYELATEVVEDITPLDNNIIEVVENDELGFVNSENQAVPSDLTYRIEEEK